MPTYVTAGCAYRYPEEDDATNRRAMPVIPENLRRWQLREVVLPKMVGLPIMVHHRMDGKLQDPFDKTPFEPKIQTAISGGRSLGKVVHAWIEPSTGALYWAGELKFDKRETQLTDQFVNGYLGMCSLHHRVDYPDGKPVITLLEISICYKGLRPGTELYAKPDVLTYMRKHGFVDITRTLSVMAAVAPPPEAVPVDQPETGTKRTADVAGMDDLSEAEVAAILGTVTEDQMRLLKMVHGRKAEADERANALEMDAKRAREELKESQVAHAALFESAWKQTYKDRPDAPRPIAIAAASDPNLSAGDLAKLHKEMAQQTLAMQETLFKNTQTAATTAKRTADVDTLLRGLTSRGYSTPVAAPATVVTPTISIASGLASGPQTGSFTSAPQNIPLQSSALTLQIAAASGDAATLGRPVVQDYTNYHRGIGTMSSLDKFFLGKYAVAPS